MNASSRPWWWNQIAGAVLASIGWLISPTVGAVGAVIVVGLLVAFVALVERAPFDSDGARLDFDGSERRAALDRQRRDHPTTQP